MINFDTKENTLPVMKEKLKFGIPILNVIENDNEEVILKTKHQLSEYFAGKRKTFDVPIITGGTPFQRTVWDELQNIPYGEVVTYKDIAKKIGNEKAVRAVGGANNKNVLPIVIPCHRVIGVNKKLVGYAGGIDAKKKLLKIENCKLFA
nr:methylated-DNA--[protein]-cysteine S-methyltransferase [Lottiidibacillus patelloidae]